MIIEVHRREGLDAPLQYNIRKLEECQAEIIARKWIPEDATGEEIAAILEANTLERKVKKPFFHMNINPAIEDWQNGLTVEQLAEMSVEAVEKLFPGVPYLVFVHKDISRWHAHAVGPCVTRDGHLIPDRYEWNRAMRISRELEIKYNLERALQHTEETRVKRAEPIQYEAGSLAQKIGDVLSLAKTYQCGSLGELNAFLSLYNCGFDIVDNDKKRGLSYYVLKDGKRVGRAIIATKIRGGALASVEKGLKSKPEMIANRAILKRKLENAQRIAVNYEEFKTHLERVQVHTVERIGKDGNVIGITFVDDENKTISNGSAISREFSYMHIQRAFDSAPGGDYFNHDEPEPMPEPIQEPQGKDIFFTAPTIICGFDEQKKKRKKRV
ncbi:MAG: relaxase/mobilization nuclease domain-containing protein [Bacteroidales bacterium]|nr:relaxase/mobilization nuclease domain-containing protein [Bacteroidales bacterium]